MNTFTHFEATVRTLKRFEYLWANNPLWLMHLPNIPNPRHEPDRAIHAAYAMLQAQAIDARMYA